MGRMRSDSRPPRDFQQEPQEFEESVIYINRVAKVVKGGRNFKFTALVAVGDKKNRVGLGYGKAMEVVEAIRKAVDDAKRQMITVSKNGSTIPYEVEIHACASTVIMRPAKKGHGIIAGGPARAILHLAGYEDVSAKFHGSNRPINCAKVTFEALRKMAAPEFLLRIRSGEKMDAAGRFIADVRRGKAEEALAAIETSEPETETGGAAPETAGESGSEE